MKAAWDWQLSKETSAGLRKRLAFARDCGFDTVITSDPTLAMTDCAEELGLRVVGIVGAYPSAKFRENHPDALQRAHPIEEEISELLAECASDDYQRIAHRRYPLVHDHSAYCFEHPASVEALEERIAEMLSVAHGVAFDGFGFLNRYACFCDRCEHIRERLRPGDEARAAGLRRMSERSLVDVTEALYDHAKSVDSDALVTNHLWPPFRPNPYYGYRLKLDYCSQTVGWFYPPNWSVERAEFEAATHARLETSENNEFVPFVGMFDDPDLRRSPARLTCELEIARQYGDGNLVFATLDPLVESADLREVVRNSLD